MPSDVLPACQMQYIVGEVLIDLHTHTRPWSGDSQVSPDELVVAARKARLDGICLTEHVWFWGHQDAAELGRRHDFLVIPGVEINTESGHCLVFGLTRYVIGMQRTLFLKELVEAAQGAMILAHPWRGQVPGKDSTEYDLALATASADPLVQLCHGIETLNSRSTATENEFARTLRERVRLPATGGGDVHSIPDVGLCVTEFEAPVGNLGALITELRAGRFRAVDLRGSG